MDTGYASDTPPTASPAIAPSGTTSTAPSGSDTNPLGEPVLAARDDKTPLPDGGTLNGDPRGPRAAAWQAIVDGAMPALQACFDDANLPPGEIAVTMRYTVERPGYTGAVTANGSAPKPVLDCCIKRVEELKFPEYRGAKVERDLAFTWSKRGVDGGAAAAAKK
ncbi:MAG: hypothetical protein LC659_12810 [Myxococcales bacterium]|nr:hypothetical protein [Myxococcales bacterium]